MRMGQHGAACGTPPPCASSIRRHLREGDARLVRVLEAQLVFCRLRSRDLSPPLVADGDDELLLVCAFLCRGTIRTRIEPTSQSRYSPPAYILTMVRVCLVMLELRPPHSPLSDVTANVSSLFTDTAARTA